MNTAKVIVYAFTVHDRSLTDTSSVSLIVGRAIVTIKLSSPVMNSARPVITRSTVWGRGRKVGVAVIEGSTGRRGAGEAPSGACSPAVAGADSASGLPST